MVFPRLLDRSFKQTPIPWSLLLSVCAATSAAHAQSAKSPYNVMYWDFGGEVFSHQSSSASTPTQPCPASADGSIPFNLEACAENFSTVGAFSLAMGVRPIRYLQIDAFSLSVLGDYGKWGQRTSNFTCVSGCSSPTVTVQTIGTLSTLLTTGARGVLPLLDERLLISAGGGFAWLSTDEHAQPTGSEQLECETCRSVSGHGPTGVAEVMYMFNQHIGVGVHVRYVNIRSTGITPAGNVGNLFYGTTYKDSFFLTGVEVSIRFGTRH
jgi:hypothetical protein